jgi:hypothetical protein
MAARGEVVAAVHSGGECLLEVRLPATGKASDNILELKKQTMAFMTDFMRQKNMSTEEGGSIGWRPAAAGTGAAARPSQPSLRRPQAALRSCHPAVPAVDLMEEVISEGEGEGGGKPGNSKKGHKGQKRKQQQQEAPKA